MPRSASGKTTWPASWRQNLAGPGRSSADRNSSGQRQAPATGDGAEHLQIRPDLGYVPALISGRSKISAGRPHLLPDGKEEADKWTLQGRRLTVPVIREPGSACSITGT